MNILFITEDHSIDNYGVTTIVSQLADALAGSRYGLRIVIAATGVEAVNQIPSVKVELIPPFHPGFPWRWSPNLCSRLAELVEANKIDLVHIHGVWLAGPWAGMKVATGIKKPVVISVHGMWSPWMWEKQGFLKYMKKKIYFDWVLRKAISKDALIHAITPVEETYIKKLLPQNRTFVIPNAIRVERNQFIDLTPEKKILFLGRLHPIKGVELLIQAFSNANLDEDWRLILAGPAFVPSYVKMLKNETRRLGVSNRVEFIGAVFGNKKWDLINRAWIQVLPSYSEGLAMINLETASRRLPSITTTQSGLSDWGDNGGLLVQPNVADLTYSLIQACNWSPGEREERGRRLYQHVLERYSWDAVIPQWVEMYEQACNRS